MKEYTITVNEISYKVSVEPGMPVLWVLRDELGITGTKYGCGIGQCGACTILENGVARRSCLIPVSEVTGPITTIEGIGNPDNLNVLQEAWIEVQVAQCGYCQSGQILSALGLLQKTSNPSDREIDHAMEGNLCRCGTYPRIREAIHLAAKNLGREKPTA